MKQSSDRKLLIKHADLSISKIWLNLLNSRTLKMRKFSIEEYIEIYIYYKIYYYNICEHTQIKTI